MYNSDFSDFWKFVLHGSVATQLKCDRIFNNCFIANCPLYVPVKEFWKSVNIWQRYEKSQSGTFFWDTVYYNIHYYNYNDNRATKTITACSTTTTTTTTSTTTSGCVVCTVREWSWSWWSHKVQIPLQQLSHHSTSALKTDAWGKEVYPRVETRRTSLQNTAIGVHTPTALTLTLIHPASTWTH